MPKRQKKKMQNNKRIEMTTSVLVNLEENNMHHGQHLRLRIVNIVLSSIIALASVLIAMLQTQILVEQKSLSQKRFYSKNPSANRNQRRFADRL